MALSNINNDRTASKIAFCSAVVAGVAYVGYSIVSNLTELTRRRKRKGDEDGRHRIFLRRLSQTTQTDTLLGEIDMGGANKIILRPKSVQERIKELNIRANQFAEAVRAIQSNGSPRPRGVSARSLQATPWTSPRVLSPVDIRTIVPHRSPERESIGDRSSPMSSPSRFPRWNRSSQKMKSSCNRKVEFSIQEDSRIQECDRMWANEQEETFKQLQRLLGEGRELSVEEAQYLVAGLNSEDETLLAEILITIANCAAFSTSQGSLREAGFLAKMPKLLLNLNSQLKEKALTAVSNMALNEKNNQEMQLITSVLVHLTLSTSTCEESLLKSVLAALTNVAVLPTWHKETAGALHKLFNLLDEMHWKDDGISLQSLRLLINLSCNEEMIPNLLAAQAPCKLIYMVDMSMPENVVLRITTLLANIATTAKRMHIDPTYDLPAEDKAAAPDTLYASIFGLSVVERLARKAQILSERHQHDDVRMQAKRLLIAIAD